MLNPLSLLSLFSKEYPGRFLVICFVLFGLAVWFITKVCSELKALEPARKNFNLVESKIGDLWNRFIGVDAVKVNSPMQLTDVGIAISTNIDGKSIAKKNLEKVIATHKSLLIGAFTIQEKSFDFAENTLFDLLSKGEIDLIETEAFNRGMSKLQILQVLGVELRNLWLEKEGISISVLDTLKKPKP